MPMVYIWKPFTVSNFWPSKVQFFSYTLDIFLEKPLNLYVEDKRGKVKAIPGGGAMIKIDWNSSNKLKKKRKPQHELFISFSFLWKIPYILGKIKKKKFPFRNIGKCGHLIQLFFFV